MGVRSCRQWDVGDRTGQLPPRSLVGRWYSAGTLPRQPGVGRRHLEGEVQVAGGQELRHQVRKQQACKGHRRWKCVDSRMPGGLGALHQWQAAHLALPARSPSGEAFRASRTLLSVLARMPLPPWPTSCSSIAANTLARSSAWQDGGARVAEGKGAGGGQARHHAFEIFRHATAVRRAKHDPRHTFMAASTPRWSSTRVTACVMAGNAVGSDPRERVCPQRGLTHLPHVFHASNLILKLWRPSSHAEKVVNTACAHGRTRSVMQKAAGRWLDIDDTCKNMLLVV